MNNLAINFNADKGETLSRFSFSKKLNSHGLSALKRQQLTTLQINLGKLCNQACTHCHVDAGPKRTEIMSWEVMSKIVHWLKQNPVETIDITGGAPELNPNFRRFVSEVSKYCPHIISRCNLTVLFEPNQEDLAKWYADNNIHLICSLPCYTKETTENQRGKGVFDKSIRALQQLNSLGYADKENLVLDLVYNPSGAFLPGSQKELELEYKNQLNTNFSIKFNNLFALANLPVSRFEHGLKRDGQLNDYMQLLLDNFNLTALDNVMCKSLLSVDYNGKAYDCDFNQMLNLHLGGKEKYLWHVKAEALNNTQIVTRYHCFGCTAGAGSSCSGQLA